MEQKYISRENKNREEKYELESIFEYFLGN